MPSRLTPADDDFQHCFARAKFNFVGKNNDELCFKKGDLISISQKTEEGWWEGTLNDKTGWFPSNYITEVSFTANGETTTRPDSPAVENGTTKAPRVARKRLEDEKLVYRRIVLEDFVDSENLHVEELKTLIECFLIPLREEHILANKEYSTVFSNIGKILESQQNLLQHLEECSKKSSRSQKIGGLFLNMAPLFKELLRTYCDNHPVVVEIIAKNRESLAKFMDKSHSDLMALITGLSSPFRRFEKYPNFLRELERNTEENHSDRGDTQRAVAIYRDLGDFCNDVRKQKEMQLELLSGTVTEWDGPAFSSLGDIIYMKSAAVKFDEEDCGENLVILFPSILIILQVSHQLNSYIFKKKIILNGVTVKKSVQADVPRTNDELGLGILTQQNILTFCSAKNDVTRNVSVLYSNSEDALKLVECLKSIEGVVLDESCKSLPAASPKKFTSTVENHAVPQSTKLHVSTMPSPGYAELVNKKSFSLSNMRPTTSGPLGPAVDGAGGPPRTQTVDNFPSSAAVCPSNRVARRSNLMPKRFSGFCLRPLTSHRVDCVKMGNSAKSLSDGRVKLRKKDTFPSTSFDHEEADILKVVEAYCTNAAPVAMKGRSFRKESESPQLLVAEEEKLFVEDWVGDELVMQEKTLVDTVYSLKDQMNSVRQEIQRLTELMLDEQKARKKSEELLRRFLISQRQAASLISTSDRSSIEQAKSHEENSHSVSLSKDAQ